MKKYFDTITNKEVKLGDYVTRKTEEKFSFGTFYNTSSTLVTESTIPVLIKAGILREESAKEEIPTNLDFYINRIADRCGVDTKEVCHILGILNEFNPAAVLQILLKEVASVVNHKKGGYKIPDTKYIFNLATGSIMPMTLPKSKYVIAFYELEDAKLVKEKILKTQFEYMYGNSN